jgi:hypothetical protein
MKDSNHQQAGERHIARVDRPEENFDFGSTERSGREHPITVALMFYVVTLGGIISACLRTLVGNESLTEASLQWVVLAGIVIGLISGGAIGFYVIKGRKAAVVSSCMGIVVGALAGGLAMVQGTHFVEIATISFIGCWLLISVMLLSARYLS